MLIKFILKKLDSSTTAAAEDSAILDEYVFDGNLLTIGSDTANTIVLSEGASEQSVVVQEGELLTLISSAEGTYLNGQKLRREAIEPLTLGDEIKIGNHIILVVSNENINGSNHNGAKPSPPINSPEQITPIAESGNEENFPEQSAESESPAQKPARNFADILNALRTEEDSFYFIVENGTQEKKENRIPLEQSEMPLGFNANGEISCAVDEIAALYAIVRKDWSGIVVESQQNGAVSVNDETIKTTRRLRNGDRVNFNAHRKGNKKLPYLRLHEPSSLVALESLLETRPRKENRNLNGAGNLSASDADAAQTVKQTVPILERRFFYNFSFFEIVSMAIGTLIAAVLIFLLLEFIVS